MLCSSKPPRFEVEHDKKNQKFLINLAGSETALLEYTEKPKGVLDLYHTEVPVSQRGKKIGDVLAQAAFKYVIAQDLKMKISCTFLQKYARDNPNDEVNKRTV